MKTKLFFYIIPSFILASFLPQPLLAAEPVLEVICEAGGQFGNVISWKLSKDHRYGKLTIKRAMANSDYTKDLSSVVSGSYRLDVAAKGGITGYSLEYAAKDPTAAMSVAEGSLSCPPAGTGGPSQAGVSPSTSPTLEPPVAPSPAPTPAPPPTPEPSPLPTPEPTAPPTTPEPEPTPVPIPAPAQPSTTSSTTVPTPSPAPTPSPEPVPVTSPVTTPEPTPAPAPTPLPSPISAPAPTTPTPAPTPEKTLAVPVDPASVVLVPSATAGKISSTTPSPTAPSATEPPATTPPPSPPAPSQQEPDLE